MLFTALSLGRHPHWWLRASAQGLSSRGYAPVYTSPPGWEGVEPMSRTRGYVAAAIGVFAVWWAAPLVRLAAVQPPVAAWWRFTVGGLAVALVSRVRGSGVALGAYTLAAGILLYVHILLWFYSLEATTVLASTALVTTYPVFIAAFEAVQGEIPRWKALLVAAPIAAAAAYSANGVEAVPAAEALLSSLSVAGYFLLLRRARLQGLDADSLAAATYMTAAAASTLHLSMLGENPLMVKPASIPYLVALGLIPMAVGHTLLNYALAYLPATIVTSTVLTEPLGAALLTRILVGETPPPAHIILSLLLLAATAAALYPQTATSRLAQRPSR